MRAHTAKTLFSNHADAIPLLDRDFDHLDNDREIYRSPRFVTAFGSYDPLEYLRD